MFDASELGFDWRTLPTDLSLDLSAPGRIQWDWATLFDSEAEIEGWLWPFTSLEFQAELMTTPLLFTSGVGDFLKSQTGKAKNFIEETTEFWRRRADVLLSCEEAREAAHNIVGFVKTLARWEKAERD